MKAALRHLLVGLANRYETIGFIQGDPSWFMHQVADPLDQETMAFLAMCLSYGSRKQFMPKIDQLMRLAGGRPYRWIAGGGYADGIVSSDQCYYRLYTYADIHRLLTALHDLFCEYGSLGAFASEAVRQDMSGVSDVESVLVALATFFRRHGIKGLVPSPYTSACKRANLYVPLDIHVLQTANQLEIARVKSAGWKAVVDLTRQLGEAFPSDPARGDFALYGYDIDR